MIARTVCLLALCFALAPAGVEAQAARSVLLRLCNDAPFDAGAAVAYRTGTSDSRTVQGWFLIPAGECLEGGLDGLAGGQIGIHVLSGEWRWPVYDVGAEYCTPANGFRRPDASGPPCGENERPARFEPVTINPYRYGWGVVDFRVSCDDFPPEDRVLCDQTPRASDGMATPLRTLEVCNNDDASARLAIAEMRTGGRLRVSGWVTVEGGACRDVYRGFPADDVLRIHVLTASGPVGSDENERADRICIADADFEAEAPAPGLLNTTYCPATAPDAVPFQTIRFGPRVARFTYLIAKRLTLIGD